MTNKHAQMREMARDLIRDSVIEDAIAQRIAQIIEFIHEDRIKPLEAKLAKAEDFVRRVIRYAGNNGDDFLADKGREALLELRGENDE